MPALCQTPKETVRHLLFECREWRRQRTTLYRSLEKAGVTRLGLVEESPEGRVFGNPKASRAILQFLTSTTVGCPWGDQEWAVNRDYIDDERGLEALEQAERSGEG